MPSEVKAEAKDRVHIIPDDVYILRTSERSTWKKCPQRWHWAYREGLTVPHDEQPNALWFGIGIHESLAHLYGPGATRRRDYLDVWDAYADSEMRHIATTSDGTWDDKTWIDAKTLGHAMLYGYGKHWHGDPDWDVIFTEEPFEIEIPKLDAPEETEIVFVSTFDGVYRDKHSKKIYLMEHKGLRLDEKILTPDGWRRNGDLIVGDALVGSDGEAQKVIGVYDLGSKPFYRVTFDDKATVDCTDDHLWTMQSASGKYRDVTTIELQKEAAFKGQKGFKYLKAAAPITAFPERDLPIDPYVLGVLIGDGGLRTAVTITNSDPDVMGRVSQIYPQTRQKASEQGSNNYQIPGLLEDMRALGLIGKYSVEKHIPREYLEASLQQRLDLLAGLMDTDGSVSQDGRRSGYSTSSAQLKEDVEELIRSLGGLVWTHTGTESYYIKDGERHYTGQIGHQIHSRTPFNPFWMKRKADKWQPARVKIQRRVVSVERLPSDDLARCIKVSNEDGLYITRDYIVTHNTAASISNQHLGLDDQGGAYWAVASTVLHDKGILAKNERIAGITYNFLRKSLPDERPVNAQGYATNKPSKEHYIAALTASSRVTLTGKETAKALQDMAEGLRVTVYGEISKAQPKPLFERFEVLRSPKERVTQIRRISEEARIMNLQRTGELPIWKNPTRDCSWCQFFNMCDLQERGDDITGFAQAAYAVRDPYADRRKSAGE